MRVTMIVAGLACAGLFGACEERAPGRVDGDPEAGRRAIAALDCGVCHVVPGVRGARGGVGPSLAGFAERSYIGGVLPNRPDTLTDWVRDAPELIPNTAMPQLPVSRREARDIAAYLYTLH